MHKTTKFLPFLALGLVVGTLAFGAPQAAAQGDNEALKSKILANLKLQFPQLEQANVTMGALEASGHSGLTSGSFTFNTPRGPQSQKFFVSDDGKLYLIAAEVDVSKSQADIDAELAKRKEEEAQKATETKSKLAEAIANDPVRGNPDGKVTIVEFSDFQCPFCARGASTMEEVLQKYGNDVKFVFKHFPLNFHPWAKPAAIAAHCVAEQSPDAFWKLHDKYFGSQGEITEGNVLDKTKEFLKDSGIDMAEWSTCAENKESDAYKAAEAHVNADMALGQSLGVQGTPGFFVNGRFLNGAVPFASFEPVIQEAKNDA